MLRLAKINQKFSLIETVLKIQYYYLCIMRLFFCLLFICSVSFCKGQINNLVANPSFEDYSGCPNNTAQIDSADFWFQPLPLSTTDYFNSCTINSIIDVPSNNFGYQFAKTGNAYAGFAVYGHGIHKEYLEGTLMQPLVANQKYCVEFYYSIPGPWFQYYFASTISIYFANNPILSDTNITIPVSPQVSETTINDTINWVKMSGSVTAAGGEKYLLIGNFEGFLNQDGGVYTYIDDVSVYLCDDTIPQPKELKIPNVFTPDNDGVNDVFEIDSLPQGAEVSIYNRWGALLFESNNLNIFWDGRTKSGAPVPDGVYYYIVKIPGSDAKKGFVEVLR